MLKKTLKYEDFNGNEVETTHYFHLSESEWLELEVDYDDGLTETIKKIQETNDRRQLIAVFKRLILQCYGEKSEDGSEFKKSDALREKFSNSAAYNALFMLLATDAKEGADFIIGVLPKEMGKAAAQELKRMEEQESQKAVTELENVTPPPPPFIPPADAGMEV